MKGMARKISVLLLIMTVVITSFAQRKVTGVIYKDGKPAAGIVVGAHKSSDSYYTSFDGVYEIDVHEKSKYIKLTYGDESKKIDLLINTGDVVNFEWNGGEVPSGDDEDLGVDLRTFQELQKDRVSDFLNGFSLYREFFKQGDYSSGLPHFRAIYKKYPKSTLQIYLDAAAYYEFKKDQAMDAETQKVYLDSIITVYDRRIKYLNNTDEVKARKAITYLKNVLVLNLNEGEMTEAVKVGYEYAQEAFDAAKEKTEPAVLLLLMNSSSKLYSVDEFSKEKVLEDYSRIMEVVEKQLLDDELKEKAEQIVPSLEKIIEGSGVLDCSGIVELYQPKYNENPNDIELIKKILHMLRKSDCTGDKFFTKTAERLYELEPSAEAAVNMARMFLKKKEYKKATSYYMKAIDAETDDDLKASYLYEIAGLDLQEGKLKAARNNAKKAVALKADYCEAYMLLGEIYGQSSKDFEGDEFQKSTVFWVAVDYFEKAAKFADCAEDGKSKAKFYGGYFPGKEEVFFKSLTEGNKYTVEGWINETTTIRVKK